MNQKLLNDLRHQFRLLTLALESMKPNQDDPHFTERLILDAKDATQKIHNLIFGN